jgi:hypothetical protein
MQNLEKIASKSISNEQYSAKLFAWQESKNKLNEKETWLHLFKTKLK